MFQVSEFAMKRFVLCFTFFLFVFAFAARLARTQNVNASLSGTALDVSGAVVPDAKVRLVSVSTGVALETKTDSNGFYSFPTVPPGEYELHASAGGFRDYAQSGIRAELGSRMRSDIKLEVGQATQTVEVTANASPLNYDNASQGGDIAPKIGLRGSKVLGSIRYSSSRCNKR
jgi:hypothetical protein